MRGVPLEDLALSVLAALDGEREKTATAVPVLSTEVGRGLVKMASQLRTHSTDVTYGDIARFQELLRG